MGGGGSCLESELQQGLEKQPPTAGRYCTSFRKHGGNTYQRTQETERREVSGQKLIQGSDGSNAPNTQNSISAVLSIHSSRLRREDNEWVCWWLLYLGACGRASLYIAEACWGKRHAASCNRFLHTVGHPRPTRFRTAEWLRTAEWFLFSIDTYRILSYLPSFSCMTTCRFIMNLQYIPGIPPSCIFFI